VTAILPFERSDRKGSALRSRGERSRCGRHQPTRSQQTEPLAERQPELCDAKDWLQSAEEKPRTLVARLGRMDEAAFHREHFGTCFPVERYVQEVLSPRSDFPVSLSSRLFSPSKYSYSYHRPYLHRHRVTTAPQSSQEVKGFRGDSCCGAPPMRVSFGVKSCL